MKVYVAPDAPPIDDGVVLVRDGRIVEVGSGAAQPQGVPALDAGCDGGVVVAGFQNSHVHLNGAAFAQAKDAPAGRLEAGLVSLLTRYGFTTAFDIASDRDNTLALRARVERGDVKGPRLLTAGLPLFPPDGLPVYLEHFDPAFLARLPQPATAAEALETVRQNLDAGAEATKLFLVTPQRNRPPKRMSAQIAKAVVDETHRRGRLVFAHPTDLDGVHAALAAGVDILAHPPLGVPGPWPPDMMASLRNAGVWMVPTLKLLDYELVKERVPPEVAGPILQDTVREFGRFAAAGGKVLFGTDVDYMEDSDPTEEYRLLAQAGLLPMQILASLTTAPAERWQESGRRGRLLPGMDADMVVLEDDPALSVTNFARVKCTVRGGQVLYSH
ncbi:amidohydrolase family protein [Roseateles cellulosilyticus]|uniref:Amidohydrolase family protein n=1 Tax=Pelomonas cellulosilytica TaxID=2906762 RepID=A0ABS8XZ56_9BURK|nr:amidohydrolase family protein [Pelomonas sp. P8]